MSHGLNDSITAMKSFLKKYSFAATLLFAASLSTLSAVENGGLIVDVQKISLERHDGTSFDGASINRKMALRINIQNNSPKPVPETSVNYVIVIQRWGMETSNFEKEEGQVKLATLPPSQLVKLNAGEIDIRGHMHGTSDRHVDHIVGWKITIIRDGKPLDFMSPTFDAVYKRVGGKS